MLFFIQRCVSKLKMLSSLSRRCLVLRGICFKHSIVSCRYLYSETKIWDEKYKKVTRIDLEKYWSKRLAERWKNRKISSGSNKEKFYCLSMFPYPSGQLHMGHVRVYTISDVMAHFHRMNGKEVLHPMGWDAFGLPAENAAFLHKLDPAEWTERNIAYMKQQFMDLNLCFDWDKEISTCSPVYYRWTQYLFVKMFEHGLAYKNKAPVNWDPADKTVLADEQVDEEGRSWRSGELVERKIMEQWFLRTTKYAQSLLDSLPDIDERVGIKAMQRHWIGDVTGSYINCKLQIGGASSNAELGVFCTNPEHLSHASHVNLHAVNIDRLCDIMEDEGHTKLAHEVLKLSESESNEGHIVKSIHAINPFTNEKLPLIITSHHFEDHRKAVAIMGLPNVNEVDAEIADTNQFHITTDNPTITREEAFERIRQLNCGQDYLSSSGLRDWLISRQRRWGTPIPIVYCPLHGAVAEDKLPVLLPGFGESLESWKKTKCPKCGGEAIRETDTMDTFVDSAWYFLRFTDPHNNAQPFNVEKCNALMPVDLYIGGKEHATLHLFFARFLSHFCNDVGITEHREPFKQLLAQGIIKGKTFRVKNNLKYLHKDQVTEIDSKLVETSTGHEVETSFMKMGKSLLNGVDPREFVSEWGVNITRLFVLYAAAPFEDIHWDVKTDVIPGVMRWQLKLWQFVGRLRSRGKTTTHSLSDEDLEKEVELAQLTNDTIEKVTKLFETSCTLSAAITLLMGLAKLTNNMPQSLIDSSAVYERSVCVQVVMTTPIVPHFTSELWEGLRSMDHKLTNDHDWNSEVLDQRWPVPQPLHNIEDLRKIKIQVNNKQCCLLYLPKTETNENAIKQRVLRHRNVIRSMKKQPITDFYFKDNLINILTEKPKKQKKKKAKKIVA